MSIFRIEVNDLSVKFGSYLALQHISLHIPSGEYWILVGENGAGKSTLLQCLALWTRPTSGTVLIDGYETVRHERLLRSRIKFVPDTPAFYSELTAWEHAQLVATLHHLPHWEPLAQELFHAFSLDQSMKAYPASYSRGMQYKLALLLCLLTQPSILLLDEPFGPLDPVSQNHLTARLSQLCHQGTTLLVTTHLLPETATPDHLVFLNQGRVTVDWNWQQVTDHFPGSIATLPYRIGMAQYQENTSTEENQ